MKQLFLGVMIMLFTSTALSDDSFEIVLTKFKSSTTYEAQTLAMAKLDDIVKQYAGFKARTYYYSKDQQQWIDIVIWENLDLAKKASASVLQDDKAQAIFSLMDEQASSFSHYAQMGLTLP